MASIINEAVYKYSITLKIPVSQAIGLTVKHRSGRITSFIHASLKKLTAPAVDIAETAGTIVYVLIRLPAKS